MRNNTREKHTNHKKLNKLMNAHKRPHFLNSNAIHECFC